MSTQTISTSKELQGVAADMLQLMQERLNTRYFSTRVRPTNSGQHLDPIVAAFFCWVIIVAELTAGANDCPEILKDHPLIKCGAITTRNWSWRMVLLEALKLLAVSEAYCFPESDFRKRGFVLVSLNFADGSTTYDDGVTPDDLSSAVGLKSLQQICELGISENLRANIPTACTFVEDVERWQAVKDAIIAAM